MTTEFTHEQLKVLLEICCNKLYVIQQSKNRDRLKRTLNSQFLTKILETLTDIEMAESDGDGEIANRPMEGDPPAPIQAPTVVHESIEQEQETTESNTEEEADQSNLDQPAAIVPQGPIDEQSQPVYHQL